MGEGTLSVGPLNNRETDMVSLGRVSKLNTARVTRLTDVTTLINPLV
jgi:hypothetical protein